MDARENWLRAVEFRYPEWIHCEFAIMPFVWKTYREDLEDLVVAHPRIFPGFQKGRVRFDNMPIGYRAGELYTDKWGCVRETTQDGIAGQVKVHPLADWSSLANYQVPDPTTGTLDPITQVHSTFMRANEGPQTWEECEASIKSQKSRGEFVKGDGERLFDRLYHMRGFENLMLDFATEPPELDMLIGMVQEYEMELTRKWLSLRVDCVSYHTDMASQQGLMISPHSFRKHVKPMFTALFQTCRRAGVHVFLSSDGRMLDMVDDMIECGVSVQDPQLRPNTLEGIARAYKGRLCACVDLDGQGFPFITPAEIREQIKECIDVLALPEGGLMLRAAAYDASIPMRNLEAIASAMEDFGLQ